MANDSEQQKSSGGFAAVFRRAHSPPDSHSLAPQIRLLAWHIDIPNLPAFSSFERRCCMGRVPTGVYEVNPLQYHSGDSIIFRLRGLSSHLCHTAPLLFLQSLMLLLHAEPFSVPSLLTLRSGKFSTEGQNGMPEDAKITVDTFTAFVHPSACNTMIHTSSEYMKAIGGSADGRSQFEHPYSLPCSFFFCAFLRQNVLFSAVFATGCASCCPQQRPGENSPDGLEQLELARL